MAPQDEENWLAQKNGIGCLAQNYPFLHPEELRSSVSKDEGNGHNTKPSS
jgi:hypothetical protein